MVNAVRRLGLSCAITALILGACGGTAQQPATGTGAPSTAAATKAAATAAAATAAAATPAATDAVAAFYTGKAVRIIVGSAPGGLPDTNSRLLATYMPQYFPGKPNIVVENKVGAGGITSWNSVFNTEPKDGTVIGIQFGTVVLQQVLGNAAVQFDSAKIQWLGGHYPSTTVCTVRTDIGVGGIQDVIAGKQVALGTTGPGTTLHDPAAVMNAALGTKFKLISGYPGIAEVLLAVEKKEVDGICAGMDPMLLAGARLLEGANPILKPVIVFDDEAGVHPFLKGKNVPFAGDLAKTEMGKQMITAVALPARMSNSFWVAPGVPADRVAALRAALTKTLADPKFIADAAKVHAGVEPMSDQQLATLTKRVLDTAPATVAELKVVLGAR